MKDNKASPLRCLKGLCPLRPRVFSSGFLFRPLSVNTGDTSSQRVYCVFGLLRNSQCRIQFWIDMLYTLSQRKLDMFVWLVILMCAFVGDYDLYGPVTKRVFSCLEGNQLASSCMLDRVRGSTISDGLSLRGTYACESVCVPVCMCVCCEAQTVLVCSFVQLLRCEHSSCRYMCARLHPICARGPGARRGPGV